MLIGNPPISIDDKFLTSEELSNMYILNFQSLIDPTTDIKILNENITQGSEFMIIESIQNDTVINTTSGSEVLCSDVSFCVFVCNLLKPPFSPFICVFMFLIYFHLYIIYRSFPIHTITIIVVPILVI